MDQQDELHTNASAGWKVRLVGLLLGGLLLVAITVSAVAMALPLRCYGRFPTGPGQRRITSAADLFLSENDNCPTVRDLIVARILSPGDSVRDRWNREFRIVCAEHGAMVSSAGPDGAFDTDDDATPGLR